MSKASIPLSVLLFSLATAFLTNPAYSAYGTISKVDIYVPSSASVGDALEVRIRVHASRTG